MADIRSLFAQHFVGFQAKLHKRRGLRGRQALTFRFMSCHAGAVAAGRPCAVALNMARNMARNEAAEEPVPPLHFVFVYDWKLKLEQKILSP